jgi:hypothetical protein
MSVSGPWLTRMSLFITRLTLILFMSILTVDASAATIVARDVAWLTTASDLIVHADVLTARQELDAAGQVWTHTTLKVRSWWKGTGPDTIEVSQLGGQFPDGRVLKIEGDLHLRPGDELVIFLDRDGDRLFSTLLAWSAFEVGQGLQITRHGADLGLLAAGPDGVLKPVSPETIDTPSDLIDLRTRVRKALGVK